MSIHADVTLAAERLRGRVRRTPLERSPMLETAMQKTGGDGRVHLKLECQQLTGSFKLRGAFNALLAMGPEARGRGVVAASTGNHGVALAFAAAELGCPALIFVPENAKPGKLERIRELGARLEVAGDDCSIAESSAREYALAQNLRYVSPYNDVDVMAGQGTIGLELEQDLDELDAVFVSVGGGGLAAGIGGYLAGSGREVELIGVSPRHSCAMHASLAAGRIVEVAHAPTLSDGTAGGLEADALTFEACRASMKGLLLVDEEEIARAMRDVVSTHHTLIEGAAGVAVAGFRQVAQRYANKRVAIVLCGANVGMDVLGTLLTAEA